jgi:hypothetical protein
MTLMECSMMKTIVPSYLMALIWEPVSLAQMRQVTLAPAMMIVGAASLLLNRAA